MLRLLVMMEKVRVSIVDSNSLFRKGLCDYFSQSEEIEVVSETDFIEDVLALIEGVAANVLVMDIDLITMETIKDGSIVGIVFAAVRGGIKALLEAYLAYKKV